MRRKLYAFALSLLLLPTPAMAVSLSEFGRYLRGQEFRQFGGEVVIQLIIGVADALILAFITLLFGISG